MELSVRFMMSWFSDLANRAAQNVFLNHLTELVEVDIFAYTMIGTVYPVVALIVMRVGEHKPVHSLWQTKTFVSVSFDEV